MKKYIDRTSCVVILWVAIQILGCAGTTANRSFESTELNKQKPDMMAVQLYVDGVLYETSHNFAAALLAFQEAQLYDSTSSDITKAIAANYLRLGKNESALRTLQQYLQHSPEDMEILELLAQIHINQQQWDEVEKIYLHMLDLEPANRDLLFSIAIFYLQKNEKNKALGFFQRILDQQSGPDPQVLVNLGELQIDMQKYGDAVETYRQLIKTEPEEVLGYFGYGIASELMGDTLTALREYYHVLDIDPGFNRARDRLADISLARNDYARALGLYEEAIRQDSTNLAGWLQLSELLWENNDTTRAMAVHSDIKSKFPEEWRVYVNAGRMYMDMRKYDAAREEFTRVIELAPDLFWGWLYSGIALMFQDSVEQALPSLMKAHEISPEDPLTNYYLGLALNRLGEPAAAIEYLRAALAFRPDWLSAISTMAESYASLNDFVMADSLFAMALSLDPDNALILNNYGYTLSERGIRLEEAIAMATKALDMEPENGAYLDTVGWIYYKMGKYEKSLEYIEKANNVRPFNPEVLEHLGDVYEKLGHMNKAVEAWSNALKLDQDNPELRNKLDKWLDE